MTDFINELVSNLDLSTVNNLDLAKFLLVMVILQFLLRTAAELLTRLSVATDSKWKGSVAKVLSQLAWYLGSFLGVFGIGIPKPILEEHKYQAIKKDQENQTAQSSKEE